MVTVIDPRVDIAVARQLIDAAMSAEQAEAAVDEFYAERAVRRAERTPRGGSGPQPRCSACCRFKSNSHQPCSCGYVPGQGYAA